MHTSLGRHANGLSQTIVLPVPTLPALPLRALRTLLAQATDAVELLLVHPGLPDIEKHTARVLGLGPTWTKRLRWHAIAPDSDGLALTRAGVELASAPYVRIVSVDVTLSSRLLEHERHLLGEPNGSGVVLVHRPVLDSEVGTARPTSVSHFQWSSLPVAFAAHWAGSLSHALVPRELLRAMLSIWPASLSLSPGRVSMALALVSQSNGARLLLVSGGLVGGATPDDWAVSYADAQTGAHLLQQWDDAGHLKFADGAVPELQQALLRARVGRASSALGGSTAVGLLAAAEWDALTHLRVVDDQLVDVLMGAASAWHPLTRREPVIAPELPLPFTEAELKSLRRSS